MTQTVIMDIAPAPQARERLSCEYVGPVAPLDSQFGVLEKSCVPKDLTEVVFPEHLSTFAVIDSAVVAGVNDIATSLGLKTECLFQGELGAELQEVAPWLIELRPHSKLTRNIFTKGDTIWDLWRKPTVLLISTDATLDELRSHLRKFTRVKDPDGNWLYFRFWELAVLRYLRKSGSSDKLCTRLLDRHRFMYPDLGPDGSEGLWSLQLEATE